MSEEREEWIADALREIDTCRTAIRRGQVWCLRPVEFTRQRNIALEKLSEAETALCRIREIICAP